MPRLRASYLCAGLLLLTAAAYLPLWNNDFVDFDDDNYITATPKVSGGLSWSGFRWAWTNSESYWMPISWLSLQLDAQLFSTRPNIRTGEQVVLWPAAFHAENLVWHAASVLLLFGLLHRLTGCGWRSFFAAALFAVHPMHVESVAWAAERKDVLSCFFGLATLWAYVRYVEKPGWKRYLSLATAFLLSLLAKPMLLTLPFLLLLMDYWPLRRMAVGAAAPAAKEGPVSLARLVLEKAPLFVLATGISVLTLLLRDKAGTVVSLSNLPWAIRLTNTLVAYREYLWATVCPLQLMVLYLHPYYANYANRSLLPILEGAGLLLGLTVLSCWQAKRRPWLAVGWLWFAGTLVPVLGLAQGGMQAWADRFSYWPHIGLFVAAAWGLGELVERLHVPDLVAAAAGTILLGCLGTLTWIQVGYWRNAVTLWERALAVQNDHHRAHANLGQYYLNRGQFDIAEAHLTEAVRLAPFVPDYQHHLGVVLLMLGKDEEAAGHFRETLQRDPDNADCWHNLGTARLRQGSPDTLDKAARCFRKALELRPDSSDAQAGLGLALWRAGKREEAVRMFQEVLRRDSFSADAWRGLGLAHLSQGQLDQAIEAFSSALRLKRSVNDCSDLGLAFARQGRWTKAVSFLFKAVQMQEEANRLLEKMNGRSPAPDSIPQVVLFRCRLAFALNHLGDPRAAEEYHAALRCDPHWPDKFRDKAWKLATDADANLRDPLLAYELASQAAEAVGDPPAVLLDTLAVAQASLGQYAEAGQTAKRALSKAAAEPDSTLAEAIRGRMQRYARGLPAADPRP